MSDDILQMILGSLARIEGKVDEQVSQSGKINERLTKIEAKQEVQEKVNGKVEELYSLKDKGVGVKQVGAWLITTAIALAGFFR